MENIEKLNSISVKGKEIEVEDDKVILNYLEIENLLEVKGLEEISNIKELSLVGNNISSIANLNKMGNLENLESLNLAQNNIRKICGLDKLKNLKILSFAQNQIRKIENLDHLDNLEELYLHENKISDLSYLKSLKKLKNLKILHLDDNIIENIAPIKKLAYLETLGLYHNKIRDIKPLKNLTKLKILLLGQNEITCIENLENNTELIELTIYSNELTKITGLNNLKKLQKLHLFNNRIKDLSGIEDLTSLKILNLNDNEIEKIYGLDKLINLEELHLGMNEISVIEGLNTLTKLEILVLNSNKISEIQNLDELTSLKYLILSDNRLSSLLGLPDLQNLKSLSLGDNKITEVEGLEEISNLKSLQLQNNEITSCEGFKNISLNELNLKENPIISSEELLKLPIKDFGCIICVDTECVIDIKDSDIEPLQKILDFLLKPLEYFAGAWGARPRFPHELEKQDLLDIIYIFNLKLSLIYDINKKAIKYRSVEPFLDRRIEIEEVDSELYYIFSALKELFKSTFSSSVDLQRTHIKESKKYFEKLRNKTYEKSINLILLLFNLLETINSGNLQNYRNFISQILNVIYMDTPEISHSPVSSTWNVDMKFLNFIIHRLIAHIMRILKSSSIFSFSKELQNPFENPRKRRIWEELKIEPIDIFEKKEKNLRNLKLYFAQINLRIFFYNQETGVIRPDRKLEISKQIKKNLENSINENCNIIIFPEYCFPKEILSYLRDFSEKNNVWIIGGVERFDSEEYNVNMNENAVIIIPPGIKPIVQKKNFPGKDEPGLESSKNVKIINSPFGIFAVLICADFLSDVICLKLKEKVDFIIVPAFNKDTTTFEDHALDRCYQNLSYIFIENIEKYGGFGIFAPLRGKSKKVEFKKFPMIKLNLNEFNLHREKKKISKKYKRPISETIGH